ncbi:hypothetical protein SDC9_57900 [bioreactor metagenome]|uniref:YqbQ/XkdQ domain-containing protein n=1 Tax=bioreactor metagenome TaxID=1076179 RepID=A0A644XBL5_9ZZZZ
MDDLKLTVTGSSGTRDVTQLVQSFTWSGAYNQCGRTLDLGFAVSSVDKRLPAVSAELGSALRFYRSGDLLFDGYLLTRQRENGGNVLSPTGYDRGIYLKKNKASYKFRNMTPEAITKRVCSDFGIDLGNLAETGVSISRNFPGVSLYQIIQTAYTLASAATGKKYIQRFRGALLDVVAKEKTSSTLVLKPGSNLLTTSVTESVEDMINRVVITDENDNKVAAREDSEAIALYGLMQTVLKQQKGKDSGKEAKQLLEENGVSQKITVTNLGNSSLIAGSCAVLKEPVTGLYGLFWIDSDTHTWKNGIYQNKLVLNFRSLMDEAEAGSLPDA